VSERRSLVIHGHFYQPPRENPWTGRVDAEASAAPDHDWNARITKECYRPLAAIRLGGADERDPQRINAWQFLSFDVGPTLLEWMDAEAADVVEAIVRADRASRERLGYGNAVAMPYHHLILPLTTRRDKVSEVRWGIADFRRRFGREPEGMWLPETAVDQESLDVLAAEGIAFTVLAPHQVDAPPADGRPVRVRTAGGRSIAVFVYDGPLSHGVAFGKLLKDSAAWQKQLLAGRDRVVTALASDGETYGHHHPFGDLALGALLFALIGRREVKVENFASILARMPPEREVGLVAPTSWSCVHGVGRWRTDCGCRLATDGKSQQRWRAPLRDAIDWLVAQVHARFTTEAGRLVPDPWAFRDEAGPGAIASPAAPNAGRPLDQLLEMERSALRAQTSCGWFFDDIAGLEALQILRYAARAIELSGPEAPRLEAGFLERLAPAESNDKAVGSATAFYRSSVKAAAAAG
jgi:uncharacterized protein DUF3536/glycosyl hydrolase family 57